MNLSSGKTSTVQSLGAVLLLTKGSVTYQPIPPGLSTASVVLNLEMRLSFALSVLQFRSIELRFFQLELAALGGRKDEFERLFLEYRNLIENYFRTRGCGEESKDLAQQTFIKAFRNLSSLKKDASFKAWILRIARNTWVNSIRDNRTQKHDTSKEVACEFTSESLDEAPDPLVTLLLEERKTQLEKTVGQAIIQLPAKMRQCVYLRVYQELKYGDIAKVMNVNINTIKSHLNQAKIQLGQLLSQSEFNLDFRQGADGEFIE